jgi:hypothetical protein
MDEKKADKKAVKEVSGDPAFYNDQIGENLEPMKANIEKQKGGKTQRTK